MKILGFIAIIAAVAAALWYFHVFEHPAVKAYREHRQSAAQAVSSVSSPVDIEPSTFLDTRLNIVKVAKTADSVIIDAVEFTRWMPPNAAGANFATVEQITLQAELRNQGGKWVVVGEQELDHNLNTYEDRKANR